MAQSGNVLEGTWEEIVRQGEQFAGKQVRVIVLPQEEGANAAAPQPFYQTATPQEWSEALFAWGHSHPLRNAPYLTDEAIGRESIYAERLDRQR